MTDLNQSQCWRAVRRRDAAHDGRFYFGVITTGVFCRPSCHSRLPLRRNVRFYASAAAAQQDGLRACRRCRPLETRDPEVERMCQLCAWMAANPEERATLAVLGRRAGVSPAHLQRRFQAVVGVSPRAYAEALRLRRLKAELQASPGIADAVYGAGFGSASRVYERAGRDLGMTPKQYRERGRGVSVTYAVLTTRWGRMLLGATDRGICFLQFGENRGQLLAALRHEFPDAGLSAATEPYSAPLQAWMAALDQYWQGEPKRGSLPLDLRATAFQIRVWRFLQTIPAGETRTYAQVARGMGKPTAARAAARACATNPVALLIPCHRVIRGDGALGGYRWGVARKRALLAHEAARAGGTTLPRGGTRRRGPAGARSRR